MNLWKQLVLTVEDQVPPVQSPAATGFICWWYVIRFSHIGIKIMYSNNLTSQPLYLDLKGFTDHQFYRKPLLIFPCWDTQYNMVFFCLPSMINTDVHRQSPPPPTTLHPSPSTTQHARLKCQRFLFWSRWWKCRQTDKVMLKASKLRLLMECLYIKSIDGRCSTCLQYVVVGQGWSLAKKLGKC